MIVLQRDETAHAYPVSHREERSDAAISLNWTMIPPSDEIATLRSQ